MSKNVLLVDDEISLRRSLSLGLSQEGYCIEPCENGVNALKKLYKYKLSNNEFDTVVLDIRLPDIDGIKLGNMLKSSFPAMNIIYITGYYDNLNVNERLIVDSSKVLVKPFTAHELTMEIEDFPEHRTYQSKIKKSENKVKTFSAYAMLKLDRDSNYLEIFRQLYFNKNILYCDALRGDYDIFLMIQSNTYDSCFEIVEKEVKSIHGVCETKYFRIEEPVLDKNLMGFIHNAVNILAIESFNSAKREFHDVVCSYLVLKVDTNKLDILYPTLFFDDNVIYCDYTDSKENNLILLVHGTQYSEITKSITERLSKLDGVESVKEYPIINIFEV